MGIISHDDWSLDRRGHQAQARHREKVQKAIKDNLADIISDEGFIISDGKKAMRIPVRTLDEPHFFYNRDKQRHIGQGTGAKGESIGKAEPAVGPGGGQGAGDAPGQNMRETDILLEDIETELFSGLRLPNFKPKQHTKSALNDTDWTDIRPKGIQSNLDRKRTFIHALKRSQEKREGFHITQDDLRFKTWDDIVQPHTGALILAMMDVSGSMGYFEKFIARTFFFWTERFLRRNYPNVEIRYLAHHTLAYEVNQEDFYRIVESGGTECSSVYKLALDIVRAEYPPEEWNVYPIHISDGDNLTKDNDNTVLLARELCGLSSMVAYLEINPNNRRSTLGQALGNVKAVNFRSFTVQARTGILSALTHFFSE